MVESDELTEAELSLKKNNSLTRGKRHTSEFSIPMRCLPLKELMIEKSLFIVSIWHKH